MRPRPRSSVVVVVVTPAKEDAARLRDIGALHKSGTPQRRRRTADACSSGLAGRLYARYDREVDEGDPRGSVAKAISFHASSANSGDFPRERRERERLAHSRDHSQPLLRQNRPKFRRRRERSLFRGGGNARSRINLSYDVSSETTTRERERRVERKRERERFALDVYFIITGRNNKAIYLPRAKMKKPRFLETARDRAPRSRSRRIPILFCGLPQPGRATRIPPDAQLSSRV